MWPGATAALSLAGHACLNGTAVFSANLKGLSCAATSCESFQALVGVFAFVNYWGLRSYRESVL